MLLFCELVSNPKQMPETVRAMNVTAIGNQDNVAVIVPSWGRGSYGNGNRLKAT